MTTLHRLPVAWSGAAVNGAAVNVLHWSGSDSSAPPVGAVLTAYQGLATIIPNGTTIEVPGNGDTIDDTTGNLTGSWSSSGGGAFTGTYTQKAAAGVGACVTWITGGIVTGAAGRPHRLRGRTFIVPLSTDAYEGNGTLTPAAVGALNTWAAAMLAAGPLAVWHRPLTVGASNGNSYGVQSFRVRDKVAVLRSRRD